MNGLFGLLMAVAIVWLFSGTAIWIVGKLGLGLEVKNIGSAFLAAIVIALVAGILTWLLSLAGIQEVGGGMIGGLVHLLTAAIVLLISGRMLSGLKVAGLAGALVGAVAIGAVYWLGGLLLGRVF